MPRLAAPLALLLLLMASSPAAADAHKAAETERGEGDIVLEEDTSWPDGTLLRNANVTVAPNVTLTVRGARVTLDNVIVTVKPDAKFVLESEPGRASALQGGAEGWRVLLRNATLTIAGLPGAPVLLDGMSGTSGFQGGTTALFVGGVGASGSRVEMRHATIRNFTAGIHVSGGEAMYEHIDVQRGAGLGIIFTSSEVHLANSTFSGAGGNVLVALPSSTATLQDLTFTDVDTAITLRGAFATVDRVRVQNAAICVKTVGFNDVRIRGLECHGFTSAGISTEVAVGATQRSTRLHVDGLAASTDADVEAIVHAMAVAALTITNSTLGPVDGPAILAGKVLPRFENLEFRSSTDYSVVLLNPPANATFDVPGTGEPGKLGWLRVIRQTPFRLVDVNGSVVRDARIEGHAEDSGALAFINRSLTTGIITPAVDAVTIDRDGNVREVKLKVAAGNATAGATVHGYVPASEETRIVLETGKVPKFDNARRLPALAPALVLLGVATLALARRR